MRQPRESGSRAGATSGRHAGATASCRSHVRGASLPTHRDVVVCSISDDLQTIALVLHHEREHPTTLRHKYGADLAVTPVRVVSPIVGGIDSSLAGERSQVGCTSSLVAAAGRVSPRSFISHAKTESSPATFEGDGDPRGHADAPRPPGPSPRSRPRRLELGTVLLAHPRFSWARCCAIR